MKICLMFADDINSRHPAILGLRNALKTACSNDVTTLTVPLLLAHQMTEVGFELFTYEFLLLGFLKKLKLIRNS